MKAWNKYLAFALMLFLCSSLLAQDAGTTAATTETPTVNRTNVYGFWVGYYNKFRFKRKLFYYGEYHIRRKNFAAEMDKIYLRFGLTYLITKKVDVTFGIATPINWADDPGAPGIESPLLEFRFWQQGLFVVPVLRSKTYHQLRTEQRWKRKFYEGAEYKLSYRWRYKFTIYVPLTHKKLEPGTVFFSFYDEIFIQTGEGITYNHFEDNRMFIGLGYIINNSVQVQGGYLWNYHHDGSPYDYESQHILRFAIYHNLDFYK